MPPVGLRAKPRSGSGTKLPETGAYEFFLRYNYIISVQPTSVPVCGTGQWQTEPYFTRTNEL